MNKYIRTFFVLLTSVIVGVFAGLLCAVFNHGIEFVTELRLAHLVPFLLLLPLAGLLIVFCYKKFGKGSDKGMGLVFGTASGTEERVPARMSLFIIVCSWITHLFGGSAGREGAAVQIGACVADFFRRLFKLDDFKKVIIVAGMAAGFAGLFRTPFTAIFFALEVMTCGILEYSALFPAVVAAFTACTVTGFFGLEKAAFVITTPEWDVFSQDGAMLLLRLVLIGILFGLTGAAFAGSLKLCKQYFAKLFPNPYIKVVVIGAVLAVVLLFTHDGRYSGLGENLILAASSKGDGSILPYDFILKLIFTVVTLSIGFQGGEVMPLFSIGASLGFFIGPFLGFDPLASAAFGYAAVFGAATNTMIAPIVVGCEVFGFGHLPYFAIVVIVARICNFRMSIYGAQKSILNAE